MDGVESVVSLVVVLVVMVMMDGGTVVGSARFLLLPGQFGVDV